MRGKTLNNKRTMAVKYTIEPIKHLPSFSGATHYIKTHHDPIILTDEEKKVFSEFAKRVNELKNGQHFWATMTDSGSTELVMMMKDNKGNYYVCGGWECPIDERSFKIIELISFPNGFTADNLYYK